MMLLLPIALLALPCLAYAMVSVKPDPTTSSTYPNRIVLIRHAEKGFATHNTDQIGGAEAQTKNHEDSRGLKDRRPKRSFWPLWGRTPRDGTLPSRDPKRRRGPPNHGDSGRKFPNGLSELGNERAQYLRTASRYKDVNRVSDTNQAYPNQLFGKHSEYNFGLIFAAPRDGDNKTDERTYATVAPLAQDLGLDIDIAW